MQRVLPTTLRACTSSKRALAARTFTSSALRLAGHSPPSLLGEGAKAGQVPSDEQQATGLDRLQLLGKMKGIDVFGEQPLESGRTGTLKDPIVVPSLAATRIIGCTGSPADSHDTIWMPLKATDANRRCPECGSVYVLGYEAPAEGEAHGHH